MKILRLAPALVAATLTLAQSTPSPGLPPLPSVNHDFDFWIGDWAVTNQATGKPDKH